MDSEVTESADIFLAVTWLQRHRKQLITVVVPIVVVGVLIGCWTAYKSHHERAASEALSELTDIASGRAGAQAPTPDSYLKLAESYDGTQGASRSLLIGAGLLFDAGKFTDAQAQFEKFLGTYPGSIFRQQALLGVAACLEAEGKISEATPKYKDIVDRYPDDAVSSQAKAALARLYLVQNKPDLALKLYEELVKSRRNDSWASEAEIQAQELLAAHPELRPTTPPPAATATVPLNLPAEKP